MEREDMARIGIEDVCFLAENRGDASDDAVGFDATEQC
jgi:hypothetical protein